jgi:ketosteroid isomerase-like protein
MISRRTELVVEQVTVRRAGEVALAEGSWRLKCDAPEGSRFAQQNATTLVLHFVEGAWKIAVIAPWGSS